MTEKRYDQDPFLRELTVQVTAFNKEDNKQYVLLDKTCFYPEGGGQPADNGTIGDAAVTDVQTVNGEIRHYVDRPLETGKYLAVLDWQRRWDHMQQHAGQHLLSALLEDRFGYRTISFHLGDERVSIDLQQASVDERALQQAELEANRIISHHVPICTRTVTGNQAHKLNLRKPPAVQENIRLVEIEGVDLNACGGTHPKDTAGIGLLKIVATEKAKGGTRLYFLCGERALRYFNQLNKAAEQLISKLQAPLEELATAADNLLAEKLASARELADLKKQLLELEAGQMMPASGVIARLYGERPIKELQQLAKFAVQKHPEASILLAAQADESMRFVCARGSEASADMRVTLNQLLAETDGKGGGTPALAQGGGRTNVPFSRFQEIFYELHAIT